MRKVLVIGWNSLTRLARDRSNIFFVFIMPMMLILVLGAVFGGASDPRVGIVSTGAGPLGDDLVERIERAGGVDVRAWETRDELILAVERGRLEVGLVLPEGFDESLRAGEEVTVEFVAQSDQDAQALRNTIDSAVTEQGALLRAAAFAEAQVDADFSEALETAGELSEESQPVTIEQDTAGEPFVFDELGRFELGAYSQLLLFIFITSLTGSAALIQSRQLGVSRRMVSTPTPIGVILAGEALGRFLVAMLQGVFIMAGTAIAFGVDWGDWPGAIAILVIFSIGAAGTAMLMGASFSNDQQAGGIGVLVGIGLGALGGAMVPLSIMRIFSDTLWQVAHVSPHAWGIEAFEELILRGGTILDIWLELAVLTTFAVIVLVLATWRLRVAITR
jgi:ABC-2 type transport system permease protein